MVGFCVSPTTTGAVLVVAAYLLGSIPFGLVIARARGIDIREVGSGNIGATNVARGLGKKLGAFVLVLDALKGAAPMLAARWLDIGATADPYFITAIGITAIAGHCFPVWLRFRGGKGVATSLGVFLTADPLVAGVGVAIFAVMYLLFRIASVGSITAAVSFPVLLRVLDRADELVLLGLLGALLVLFTHRGNISRLLSHNENKV